MPKQEHSGGAGNTPRSTTYRRYSRYTGPDRPDVVATANLSNRLVATMWANTHLTIVRFAPTGQPTDFIELNRLAAQRLYDLFLMPDVSRLLGW